MDKKIKNILVVLIIFSFIFITQTNVIDANENINYIPSKVSQTIINENSRGFTWYTNSKLESIIKVYNEVYEQEFLATTKLIKNNLGVEFVHKVQVNDLPVGTYNYYVGSNTKNIFSDTYKFSISSYDEGFNFLFVTDTQASGIEYYNNKEILKLAAQNTNPHFVVHAGDLTNIGRKEQHYNDLFENNELFFANNPIAIAAGNHDGSNDNMYNHFNYNLPEGYKQNKGMFYSFDYCNVHFVVLNTNDINFFKMIKSKQIDWLKKDVESARKNGSEWIIVTLHKAIYTTGRRINIYENKIQRSQLANLFYEMGVDLVLQGHDHVYYRSEVLGENSSLDTNNISYEVNNNFTNPDGAIYAIGRSAGNKFYSPTSTKKINKHNVHPAKTDERMIEIPVYTNIKIINNTLTYNAYELDIETNSSSLLDSFTITKTISKPEYVYTPSPNLEIAYYIVSTSIIILIISIVVVVILKRKKKSLNY